MNRFFFVFLFLAHSAFAQDTGTSVLGLSALPAPIENHKNYLAMTIAAPAGASLSYGRRMGGQLLLGTTLGGFSDKFYDKSGGSLDTAQYYQEEVNEKAKYAEINTTFYFRDNGTMRWGPGLRGGLGYAERKVEGKWTRYDRDPGFFHIGDDKRARESQVIKEDWSTPYARAGAFYQFLFQRRTEALIVGHVLELGATGLIPFKRGDAVKYTKPNGESVVKTDRSVETAVEFKYSIIF